MSDVKRYNAGNLTSGEVVMAADYDALLAENEELRVEAAGLIGDMAQIEVMRDQLRAQVEEQLPRLIDENHKLRAELDAIRGQEAATALELRKASSWICREVEAGTTSATHWAIRLRERADQIESGTSQQPDAVSVPGVNEFAVEILRGALEGGSFDGGDIQEMGVKYGLLFPEQRTEPCCESGCNCAEFGFPAECFRIARALLSTRQAEEGE